MTEKEAADIVFDLMKKVTQLVLDTVPHKIMKTSMGSMIMYNLALNYLQKVTLGVGFDKDKALKDLALVFDESAKQEEEKKTFN